MPSRDSKRNQHNNNNYGYGNGRSGGGERNHVIPNEPPYTAYIGNAPDSMVQGDFEKYLFNGLKVKQVRLVRDRQTDRFRGFAYVDFEDADSLRQAIALDGTSVNDRPIRIDVAIRPLGGNKSEGFRNKPDFEARRHPSGNNNNNNNNRSNDRYRQNMGMNDGYYQQETYENVVNAPSNEQNRRRSIPDKNTTERRHSQSQRQHKTPPRKASDDDVFIGPDTPASNDDGIDQNTATSFARQESRNWADCPIDESVIEPSPPPSANNTFNNEEDFQVIRNRTSKGRNNQQSSGRSMGNQSSRGRNHRGGSAQMAGDGRGYYDQMPSQYSNQSQQYYHHQQLPPQPLNMAFSYHLNNNNRQQQPAAATGGGGGGGPRQRVNSNRSNQGRNYNDNHGDSKRGNNDNFDDINNNPVSAENRPKLQLLPRSQKLSSSTDDNQIPDAATRNASIFGCGKPRDERDPKVMELNKHIEEVVEKEQHAPETKSSASDGSIDGVNKPVKILTATT